MSDVEAGRMRERSKFFTPGVIAVCIIGGVLVALLIAWLVLNASARARARTPPSSPRSRPPSNRRRGRRAMRPISRFPAGPLRRLSLKGRPHELPHVKYAPGMSCVEATALARSPAPPGNGVRGVAQRRCERSSDRSVRVQDVWCDRSSRCRIACERPRERMKTAIQGFRPAVTLSAGLA